MSGAEPILIGAALGAGGSLISGGNPLQGALMGAAGGIIGPAIGGALSGAMPGAEAVAEGAGEGALGSAATESAAPNFLGGLTDIFKGGSSAANLVGDAGSDALSSATPGGLAMSNVASSPYESAFMTANPDLFSGAPVDSMALNSSAPTSSGFFSKYGPSLGIGAAGLLANKFMAPKTSSPPQKDDKPLHADPLSRVYTPVDPASYLTAGGNRSFFDNVNPMTKYYADGGPVTSTPGAAPMMMGGTFNPSQLPAPAPVFNHTVGWRNQPSSPNDVFNHTVGWRNPDTTGMASNPVFNHTVAGRNPPPPPNPLIGQRFGGGFGFAKGGAVSARGGISNMAKFSPQSVGGRIANPKNMNPSMYPIAGRKIGVQRYYDDGGAVMGPGDGQADQVPANLSDGEFVMSAPAVAALGNGSNKAGAKKLKIMQSNILRKHYKGGASKKAGGLSNYMSRMQ